MTPIEKFTPDENWLHQRERAVAWLRVGFAALAVFVIRLNPERVARFPELSFISLGTFLVYSLALLYLARQNRLTSAPLGILTNALDVVWIAVIVFSTGGTRTPFFFYYSFPVITASIRWGLKGSIPAACAGVILYGIVRLTLAAEAVESPLPLDTLLVRSLYLLVLGGIFGYISEFERKQNQRLLTLSKTAAEVAALQERRRITFELHDGILQSLATLILRLEGCRGRLPDTQAELLDEMRVLEDMTRDSMKEIRQFLAGQTTKPLIAGTLVEKLREWARFLRDGMGLDVILESEPEEINLPAETEREIYYVLREALTNVTRHSHASKVDIHLARKNGHLEGSLSDNGVGFHAGIVKNETGFGLTAMEQRVKKIGGEFFLKSAPGAGTRITFLVPVAPQPQLEVSVGEPPPAAV
jgi:signal transduction histidine kinase